MDQLVSWVLLFSLSVEARLMETDVLKNLYVVQGNHLLEKRDSTGALLYQFQLNRFGTLAQLDVSDPMKLLVSYPDYGMVVLLDNTLSELTRFSMSRIGIVQMGCLAHCLRDRTIWIFDRQQANLKKINYHGTVVWESADVFQQIGHSIDPVFMVEYDSRLYMTDPQYGIFVFDSYGIFMERLPLRGLKEFQIVNNQIVYAAQNAIHWYNLETGQQKMLPIPADHDTMSVRIDPRRLIVRTSRQISCYAMSH